MKMKMRLFKAIHGCRRLFLQLQHRNYPRRLTLCASMSPHTLPYCRWRLLSYRLGARYTTDPSICYEAFAFSSICGLVAICTSAALDGQFVLSVGGRLPKLPTEELLSCRYAPLVRVGRGLSVSAKQLIQGGVGGLSAREVSARVAAFWNAASAPSRRMSGSGNLDAPWRATMPRNRLNIPAGAPRSTSATEPGFKYSLTGQKPFRRGEFPGAPGEFPAPPGQEYLRTG